MLITETKTVQRELHVAPCLACGHTDIALSDNNYSAFNSGGGTCRRCGHEVTRSVGCLPSLDELAAIWNAGNDIPTLIRAEEAIIAAARTRIADLKKKLGPALSPLTLEDLDDPGFMTAEAFLQDEEAGFLTGNDGSGFWATATHRSDLSTYAPRPEWATHVLWFNR